MTSPAALKAAELKACPFCGDPAETKLQPQYLDSDKWYYQIWCSKCGIEQRHMSLLESDAIAAWNTRAPAKHFPSPVAAEGDVERVIDNVRELLPKITPGPWEPFQFDAPQWVVRVAGTKFRVICTTSQNNDEANAALIALAPEMAQALSAQPASVGGVGWHEGFRAGLDAAAKVVIAKSDAYGGYPDRASCNEIATAIRAELREESGG